MDIDKLKQAAFDAYMKPDYDVDVDDDSGERYSRPGERVGPHGTGFSTAGGVYSPVDLSEQYESVCKRVDEALAEWTEDRLPKPGQLNSASQWAQDPVIALNLGDGRTFGGSLGAYAKTIFENAPQMRGAAMDAFNNSFVNQLPAVINNHACLSGVIAEAWAAEQNIWQRAREDRDKLVEKTTEAMTNYAKTDSPSFFGFVLALAGAAVSGASALVTKGPALPYGLASAGITSLSAINDYVQELEVEEGGANYEELMEAFESGLKEIDAGISKQEALVVEGLRNAIKVFDEKPHFFSLKPRVSDDGDGTWSDENSVYEVHDAAGLQIVLPNQAVIESSRSGFIHLAGGIEAAAQLVVSGSDTGSLLTASARGVGLRSEGVSPTIQELCAKNEKSLQSLGLEIHDGLEMLMAVIEDFRENDAESQAALDSLRRELGRDVYPQAQSSSAMDAV